MRGKWRVPTARFTNNQSDYRRENSAVHVMEIVSPLATRRSPLVLP